MELAQTSATINTVNLNATWSLPNYEANELLLSQIELELRKNGNVVVQSVTFTAKVLIIRITIVCHSNMSERKFINL